MKNAVSSASEARRQGVAATPTLAAQVDLDHIPGLVGEMEQLRAILWARLMMRRAAGS